MNRDGNMPATAASKHTTKSTNNKVPTVATYMVLVAPPWGGVGVHNTKMSTLELGPVSCKITGFAYF